MLVTRVDKESPDITRIVVDLAWWLDPNEHITQIVSAEVIQGMSGWSEAPYPPPDSPPPYDPTPLILNSVALDATQRMLGMFVEFGSPGVAYTIQFIVDGTSQRRLTFEVGVQITGIPLEEPKPLPPPPSEAAGSGDGERYVNIKGGTMEGPLYLFHDPVYPTEAVTKHYVDRGGGLAGGPFMAESGGEFTGPVSMGDSALTLSPTSPTDPLEAASKQYVDGLVGTITAPYLPLSGGTMLGMLTLAVEPLDTMDAATKGYVDTRIGAASVVTSFNTRMGAVVMVAQDIMDVGGALLDSPTFFGTPHAPTASPGTSTTQLATTEFVTASIVASTTGVSSFNTRTGDVVLALVDITSVGGAPLASPAFSGNPTAPTPAPTDNDTSIATTAFVQTVLASVTAGVTSFNTRTGAVVLTNADVLNVFPGSAALPVMNGTASAGVATAWSKGDHVHPVDTSRYAASNPAGYMTSAQVASVLSGYLPLGGGTLTGGLTVNAGFYARDRMDSGGPVTGTTANFTSISASGTGYVGGALSTGGGIAAAGNISGASVQGGIGAGNGFAQLVGGGPTHSGYVGCFNPNGSRAGYLGFADGSQMTLISETSPELMLQASSIKLNAGIVWTNNRVICTGTPPGDVSYALQLAGSYTAGMALNGNGFLSLCSTDPAGVPNGNFWMLNYGTGYAQLMWSTAYKPGGGSWADNSDARVKTVTGTYDLGLNEVLALNPIRYHFNGNDMVGKTRDMDIHSDTETEYVGFVAQEVEAVFPDMVTQVPGFIDDEAVDDLRVLNLSNLPIALVNAVKTLHARVLQLEQSAAGRTTGG